MVSSTNTTGPRASTKVMFCSQLELLSQKSVAVNVRVNDMVPSGVLSSPSQSTWKFPSLYVIVRSSQALQLSVAMAMPKAVVVVSSAMS